MEKVRLGVIGLGGMGRGHIKSIKDISEAHLTAVSDIDSEVTRRTSQEYGVPGFTNYKELLQNGLVDAVLIATPHYFHSEIGIVAMKKGVHCLSEKPIAVSVSAAHKFVEEAQESGVVFAVMYQQRTLPQVRLAREIMESGKLGQIRRTCMIEPDYRSQAYYDSATWRATWKGEGVLINQAPHGIDLFLLLGGVPSRVTAMTRTRLHKFTFSTEEMWARPEVVEEELEFPQCETGHKEIIRNFCRSILFKEELIAPGKEGIWSVEFINALLFSGKKRKPIDIPVDREEYEDFLNELKKISRGKRIKRIKRITDPRHLKQ